MTGYSSVMIKSASMRLSIESGAMMHECLASWPHAFVRPMTCANPSHVKRIASKTPRRMSPFSSYATVITPDPTPLAPIGTPLSANATRVMLLGAGELTGLQLRALRGATTASANTAEAIDEAVGELINALVLHNRLDGERVAAKLEALLAFCRRFRERPRLVVAGLNPHAGEGGALGREERDWLIPCLAAWRERHPEVTLEGPLPPDTCWLEAAAAWKGEGDGADGYLALYHDQGLIPVKLLAFDAAVNTTLGLPFLRTSPDHGTAFAIAGRGVARADSMAAAIRTAWELG
jgi:hypothetical protein